MTELLRCAGCQSSLRMRPEYAGKKLRCPKCKATMSIPAQGIEDPPPLPDDDGYTNSPTFQDDYDAPRQRSRSRDGRQDRDPDDDSSEWVPCPRCGARESERVLWTFWGSFYGPAMFSHVQCPECSKTYNGKTGRSNFIPALIFTTIPLLLIMGIIGVTTWIILSRQF